MRRSSGSGGATEAVASRLVSEAPALLSIVDFAGEVVAVNPAIETTLGWAPPGRVSAPMGERLHPDDRAEASRKIRALVSAASAMEFGESRLRHRDGSYRWIVWTAKADARARKLYLAGQDVTAHRERVERVMRTRARTFRTAFEHAPIGIGVVDAEGSWIDVNDPLCDLLGYSRRDLKESAHVEAMADESFALLQRMLADGPSNDVMRIRYLRASDGFLERRSTITLARDVDGKPLHFICQVHQISAAPGSSTPTPAGHEPPTAPPSRRELDVLRLAAQGFSTDEIARDLTLSPTTVKTHLQHLYAKLGATNRANAVAEAFKRGLI
jgi:PAS domain S-box-containing protein